MHDVKTKVQNRFKKEIIHQAIGTGIQQRKCKILSSMNL